MAINWEKYGVKTERPMGFSSIDWDKYTQPTPTERALSQQPLTSGALTDQLRQRHDASMQDQIRETQSQTQSALSQIPLRSNLLVNQVRSNLPEPNYPRLTSYQGGVSAEDIVSGQAQIPSNVSMQDRQRLQSERTARQREQAGQFFEGNPISEGIRDYALEPFARGVESLQNTPAGQFLSRIGTAAGSTMGIQTDDQFSTGSRAADTASDVIGGIGGYFVNPASFSQGPMALYNNPAVQSIARRLGATASRGGNVASRMAEEAAREGIAAAAYAVPRSLITGNTSAGEIAQNVAVEGALGAAGGGLLAGASPMLRRAFDSIMNRLRPQPQPTLALPAPEPRRLREGPQQREGVINVPETEPRALPPSSRYEAAQSIRESVSEPLALPESERYRRAMDRSRNAPNTEPIRSQVTPELPEASPEMQLRYQNIEEGRRDLGEINQSINELESRYQQAINEQYQYLKSTRDLDRGDAQRGLIRDQVGEVTDRFSISGKPAWQQEFFRETGKRRPNNKELYELAKKHVDEGFIDDGGQIPSWRAQNNFDETMSALTTVRDQVQNSLRELDPAITFTDSELIGQNQRYTGDRRPVERRELPRQTESPQIDVEAARRQMERFNELVRADRMTRPLVGRAAAPQTTPQVRRQGPFTRVEPEPPREEPMQEPQIDQQPTQPAEPTKQNWFTRLFGEFGIGITPAQLKGSSSIVTTADQIVGTPLRRDVQGAKESVKASIRALYQNNVDMLNPLKKIDQDVYEKAIDANRANNIANVIIRDKFVDLQGQVQGEGLENIYKKLGRGEVKEFNDYIILRRALDRMNRGEKVYDDSLNMTPEKVQKRIEQIEKKRPNFINIANELTGNGGFYDNLLRVYGVEEELISPELYQTLRQKEPNYVPMRRQFSTSEKFASPTTMKARATFSGQKAPIKEVSPTGSARRIVDPRRTTIEMTAAWTNAALRNRVMRGIVDKIRQNPENFKDIAEIVQPEAGQKNLVDILRDEGQEEFLETMQKDFDKLFQRTRLDQDNIVRAMVKGEPVYVKVKDPEAVKALLGLGAEQSNLILDIFGFFSDLTKMGATGVLAPMFSIKSITWDTVQAMIQADRPVRHFMDFLHAVVSSLADKLPQGTPGIQNLRRLSQDFRRAGGEYSAMLRGDRRLRTAMGRMARDPILSPQGMVRGVGRLAATPYRALHGLADMSENLNRMAAFKSALREQGGDVTADSIRQALMRARESTVNWSRRGSHANTLEKLIPYQNAAVQGMYKVVSALRTKPIKITARVGALIIAPKIVEYMVFKDDPEYNKIPARERYRNIYVRKNDDGTFVKIPLTPEYAGIGALTVDFISRYLDGNEDAFKGVPDAILDNYTPPVVSGALQGVTQDGGLEQSIAGMFNSTVAAPFVAILSNQSFTGAPIVPQRFEGRSAPYQYDERTSSVARQLGQALNMSPFKVDYLIRAYGGDPARLLLPLTSEIGAGRPRQILLRNFIVDPAFTNTLADDFYSGKLRITQAYTDAKDAGAPLPDWLNEELYRVVTSRAKGSPSYILSELQKAKREVSADTSLSAEERAELTRDIQQEMNNIYLDVNAYMHAQGVPLSGR